MYFDGAGNRSGFKRDGSQVDLEITFPWKQIMVPSRFSNSSLREHRHVGRISRRSRSFWSNMIAEIERDARQREQQRRWAMEAHRRGLRARREKRKAERLDFCKAMRPSVTRSTARGKLSPR